MKTSCSPCTHPVETAAIVAESIGPVMFVVVAVCLALSMALAAVANVGFRDIVYESALGGGAIWAGATAAVGELGANSSEAGLLPASLLNAPAALVPTRSAGR